MKSNRDSWYRYGDVGWGVVEMPDSDMGCFTVEYTAFAVEVSHGDETFVSR